MIVHEINVSELIAGNKFTSVSDGRDLYNELDRLLNDTDKFKIDFLGISRIGIGALMNSIGRLYIEGIWNKNTLDKLEYVNLNSNEFNKIMKFLDRVS